MRLSASRCRSDARARRTVCRVSERTGSERTEQRRPRRRDRHGRGMRGVLAPRGVPISRTRAQTFDEVVLDAVEHLESHWPGELDGIEFAVDDVPAFTTPEDIEFDADVVADHGIALGRLLREGADTPEKKTSQPVVLIFRRPIEARTAAGDERSSLVFAVVAELVAQLTGKDIDDIHP